MAVEQSVARSATDASTRRARVYTHPLLLMLLVAYICNFMDRTVVGTLAQAIKLDLHVTDTELGLLQGFAFVVLYSVVGVPIARMAERRDRITIMSVCIALWSVMTVLCGMTQNFVQLLLCRVGVGIAEAGCNAPSHSMIADAFPPEQRSRAISIYNSGNIIGTMIGAILGGIVAEHYGWRTAFFVVGAPGLAVAVLLRLVSKDPGRVTHPGHAPTAETAVSGVDVRATTVARIILRRPALRYLVLGFTLTSFAHTGMGSFSQAYYIRAFGLTYGQLGLLFGIFGGIAGLASMLSSGRMTDSLIQRDQRWHAWLPAIGVVISIPLLVVTYNLPSWPVALTLGFVANFFLMWFAVPSLSAFHKLVGERRVAMAMALILMFQNFLGLGGGPFFTGAAIDFVESAPVPRTMAWAPSMRFARGRRASGASPEIAAACKSTLVSATRLGMMMTLVAQPLAAICYLLAARHLQRELPPAAAKRRTRP